jgi:inosine-uridine nucleoside N-ribohydrolase
MGGAFFVPGNVSPVAEFNVWYDPQSAKVMYESGATIVAAPLDITTKSLFSIEDLRPVLKHINHPQHKEFLTKLTEFTIGTNMMFRETHYRRGFFIHDAHTIGFLLYPHLYKGSFYQVQVETQGEYTSGQTVIDARNHPKQSTNAFVITDVDAIGFLEAMTEDFKEFDFSS